MGRVSVVGYLSIDSIATPGGRHDDVPGGAALYAALGAHAAGADVTLHATAGEDFPQAWLDAVARLGIDVGAVQRRDGPTRRARLSHARDGTRASVHHREDAWWQRTAVLAPVAPDRFAADVVAMAAMPIAALRVVFARARADGATTVIDTSEAFARRDGQDLLALLTQVDVFAPSREETRILLPGLSDDAAALALARGGCRILQKRGADGAMAVADGRTTTLAAPPTDVVDPTGAGDATVGALAAHLAAGVPFLAAAGQALAIGARAVSAPGPAALGLRPGDD